MYEKKVLDNIIVKDKAGLWIEEFIGENVRLINVLMHYIEHNEISEF